MADGAWDLTRSMAFPITSPKKIPAVGTRSSIIIEPSRSALVIIDMQSEPTPTSVLNTNSLPHANFTRFNVNIVGVDKTISFTLH